tara:strand:- start:266 stop:457 length:192 start_codon:yes stop_codon:yes gene_type:complete
VDIKEIGLSQQVWDQLKSVGIQKQSSPLETLEMTLRQHFGMSVPEKWKIESWIQSGVVYEQTN